MTLIKDLKPTTPGQRHRIILNKSFLKKEEQVQNKNLFKSVRKKLSYGLKKKGGRNNLGRITVFHQGGGHKRLYRIVDFKRSLLNVPGKVLKIEYDPNRSVFIALINSNGIYHYILAPKDLKIGDYVESGENVEIKVGNTLPLKNIPNGTLVHNIELKPGQGGKLMRSAGTFGKVISKKKSGYIIVELNSKRKRLIDGRCFATIGTLSNIDHKRIVLGKAGASRWLGIRPTVRGVAMNPVDHPHGGGEGRTSGGRPSSTPWGYYTKGYKTRKKKLTNKFII